MTGAIDLEINPKIEAFRSEMMRMPGISQDAADRSAEALRKQLWVKAAKDAAGLTDKLKREAEKQKKHFEEVANAARASYAKAKAAAEEAATAAAKEQAAAAKASEAAWGKGAQAIKGALSQVGGVAGQVGGLVFEVGEKAAGSIGLVGGAAAGVVALGVAALGAAKAVDSIVDSASEAVDRLKEIGGSPALPQKAIDSIKDYEQATLGAEVQWDRLKVGVGSALAQVFGPGVNVLAGFVGKLADMVGDGSAAANEIKAWSNAARVAVGVATLGASEAARYAVGLDDLAESAADSAEGLRDYKDAAKDISAYTTAAEKVAAIQREAIIAATGATDAQQRMAKQIDENDVAVSEYVKSLDDMVEAGQKSREEADALAAAAQDAVEIRNRQIVKETEAAEAAKKLAKEEREQAKAEAEATKAAREDAAARTKSNEAVRDAVDLFDHLEAEQIRAKIGANDAARANEAWNREVEQFSVKVDQANAAFADFEKDSRPGWEGLSDMIGKFGENALDAMNKFEAALGPIADGAEDFFNRRADAAAQAARDEIDNAERIRDAYSDQQTEQIDGLLESGRISQKQHDAMIRQVEDGERAIMDAARDRAKDERDAALKSFKVGQQIARGKAIFEAGVAALTLIPAFGFMGPFAPVGAATAAGAALALQLSAINEQEPPSFPMGGPVQPDHHTIAVQGGEIVANRRAAAMPEVRDAVEAGNRGERPASGSNPLTAREWNRLGRVMANAYVTGARRIGSTGGPSKIDHNRRGRV